MPIISSFYNSANEFFLFDHTTHNYILCTDNGVKKIYECGIQSRPLVKNNAVTSGYIMYEENPKENYVDESILAVDTAGDIIQVDRNTLFHKYSSVDTDDSIYIQNNEHYFLISTNSTKTLPLLSEVEEGYTVYFRLTNIVNSSTPKLTLNGYADNTFSDWQPYEVGYLGLTQHNNLRQIQFTPEKLTETYIRICKYTSNGVSKWVLIEFGIY